MPRPASDPGTRRVVVGGAELAVRIEGAGPPFVWGHGLLSSIAQEDETGVFGWRSLTGTATVVRYDARGHGESTASRDPDDYTWPSLATDMLAVLDALELDRATIGGASMGCATAIYTALRAPERVQRLVLAIPPTAWGTRAPQRAFYAIGARTVTLTGMRALVATMRSRPVPPVAAERDPDARDRSLEHLLRADKHAVSTILRGAGRSDLPPAADLAVLTMPVLLLAWVGDPTHPVTTAEKLADVLPAATLHIASAGRDLDTWSGIVRDFLSSD